MTREEAKEWLIPPTTLSNGNQDDPVNKHWIAYRMAIEALEQESVLDKIRAEIHATAEMHEDGDYYLRDEWIDEIFDKYKAENDGTKVLENPANATCTSCILDGTDACSRGAGRAVDGRVCEDFIGKSEG